MSMFYQQPNKVWCSNEDLYLLFCKRRPVRSRRPIFVRNPHREMIVRLASIADVGFGFFHSVLWLWHIPGEDLKPIGH